MSKSDQIHLLALGLGPRMEQYRMGGEASVRVIELYLLTPPERMDPFIRNILFLRKPQAVFPKLMIMMKALARVPSGSHPCSF